MAKTAKQDDAVEKLGRRVEKARLKLEVAQAKQTQARERGKQEVERARVKAAEWLAVATERVDRRAQRLETLEVRLIDMKATDSKRKVRTSGKLDKAAAIESSPEAVASALEQIEAEVGEDRAEQSLIISQDFDTPDDTLRLRDT